MLIFHTTELQALLKNFEEKDKFNHFQGLEMPDLNVSTSKLFKALYKPCIIARNNQLCWNLCNLFKVRQNLNTLNKKHSWRKKKKRVLLLLAIFGYCVLIEKAVKPQRWPTLNLPPRRAGSTLALLACREGTQTARFLVILVCVRASISHRASRAGDTLSGAELTVQAVADVLTVCARTFLAGRTHHADGRIHIRIRPSITCYFLIGSVCVIRNI